MVMGQFNMDKMMLIGSNKKAGLNFTDMLNNPEIIDHWNITWPEWRGYLYMFGIDDTIEDFNEKQFTCLSEFYQGRVPPNEQRRSSTDQYSFTKDIFTEIYSDSWYHFGVHDFFTRHHSNVKDLNVYQYMYDHAGEHSHTSSDGVSNGDEMFLQFQPYLGNNIILNEEDQEMSDLLMTYWKTLLKIILMVFGNQLLTKKIDHTCS